MLDSCLKHRKAIDTFTGDKKNGLRVLEVSAEEWTIVKQLRNVLKVCPTLPLCLGALRGTPTPTA